MITGALPTFEYVGVSYPDIIFYHGLESTTAEKASNGGDATGSLLSDAVISSAQKAVGSNSLYFPTIFSYMRHTVTTNDILNTSAGRAGFYIYITTWSSNINVINYRIDGLNFLRVSTTIASGSRNALYYEYRAGATAMGVTSAVENLAASTWHFVEVYWNTATPAFSIKVNNANITTDTTSTGTIASSGFLCLGDYEGNVAPNAYIDQVIISTDTSRDLYALRNTTSFPD